MVRLSAGRSIRIGNKPIWKRTELFQRAPGDLFSCILIKREEESFYEICTSGPVYMVRGLRILQPVLTLFSRVRAVTVEYNPDAHSMAVTPLVGA